MACAVVIGATGGIGRALVAQLEAHGGFAAIHALSRRPDAGGGVVRPGRIDLLDPPSITAAAAAIGAPVDLLIVATGALHGPDGGPERTLRALDAAQLARSFAVNATGPALAIAAFARLLPRDRRAVIACLSARVGSIADNRTGGWYGYRASKAALNQIVRTAGIEIARTHPQALCVALHPGTVDTELSRPFQASVSPDRLFTPARAAAQLLDVLERLVPGDTGRCFAWDGTEIAP